MRRFFEKHGRSVVITFVVLISLMLITAAVSTLWQYSNEVTEQSATKAAYFNLSSEQEVSFAVEEYKTRAIVLANTLSRFSSDAEIREYLFTGMGKEEMYSDVKFVRYYQNGTLYSSVGDVYSGTDDVSRQYYAENRDRAGFIGSFIDRSSADGVMTLIGFYAPVPGSDRMDGVVVYYTQDKLRSFFREERDPDAEFSVLCTRDGVILVGAATVEHNQIINYLRERDGDRSAVDQVRGLMQSAQDGTVPFSIGGVNYVVSVGCDREQLQDLCVVEMYRSDVLYTSSFEIISTCVGIFILFTALAIGVVVYLMIHRARLRRKLANKETMDVMLNCPNRYGFEQQIRGILDRNPASYFGIVVFQLRHYKYLLEMFGESEINHLLGYLRIITAKTAQLEELYGHIEEGQFLMMLHARDRQDLIERLKLHASIAGRYKGANAFDVSLKYGIYEIDRTDVSITPAHMVDLSLEANNSITRATVQNATMQFNFYNNEIRKIHLINEDMELRMEGALQSGEFQVFYQPKYNLNLNRQDGSEALVRWYDPKTGEYNRPALFMPLFESNGFIVKLDKYVYSKVCEYISYSLANGRTVFPVSVNVSRITAAQADFIEYYTKVKKKFGIADDMIMIEFTESFAYENDEMLYRITEGLHKNGFRCAIDDFGCGYSSYRILKTLPMDEIKLDKFFLQKGTTDERDRHIIENIIELGKKLGMKVTQEGVETAEDVERLRALGCDVIQGYYYAHPLALTDYLAFVANTREHNARMAKSDQPPRPHMQDH